ncbi:MAG: phycocyanin alpha phycocyanobilin lyase [Planctomycetaceae bacterium]
MSRFASVCCLLLLCVWAPPAVGELTPDFQMETDPEFHALPLKKDFQRDFKGLWRQALQRPEADYQRLAAETVARAHRHGIPGLQELTPELETILTAPASHPAARFAAARALIALESRSSADKLLESGLKYGAVFRQLVEPALADWDFAPARDVWRKRLETPRTFPADLTLALRGLGHVQDADSLTKISAMALDLLRPSQIRLEAAQAAGDISDQGLETAAEQLAHDRRTDPQLNRWCALRLLTRHSSSPPADCSSNWRMTRNPPIAAALDRLNQIDPQLVVPLAEQAFASVDPLVRAAGVHAYLEVPTPERIKPLARLLDDDHPAVRKLVAEGLSRLAAKPELGEPIRAESMTVLAGDRWQGQQQAALLLGSLEHRPAAKRMSELLESPRPEVMVAAAWGLRKVADPETVPAIIDKIRRQTVERKRQSVNRALDEQVAHLFEACGRMQAQDAEPLMREYIPRDDTRTMDLSRSAAIWALGRLHEGTLDAALAGDLISRVMDTGDRPPECPVVKRMAVVALVRMKAVDQAMNLKSSLAIHQLASALDVATRWAVRELSGEELPPPTPLPYPDGTWFLEPLRPPLAGQP